jgi:hypothetical protein
LFIIEEGRNKAAVDGLLVADKPDLARFRIDG